MNYIEVSILIFPEYPWKEVITQELAAQKFDSFMEENNRLLAYIPEEDFDENQLKKLFSEYREKEVEIKYEYTLIPSQNWNATWESDYHQVEVGEEILIRAPFHPVDTRFRLNIEIQPQMSFGTGHHQTTFLLCKALLSLNLENKTVLDVGTGTGILGIVASKLGAKEVLGTDIEKGAVENAEENIKRNAVSNFSVIQGDIQVVPERKFDFILANINKNVLLRHFEYYEKLMAENGLLLISGFFKSDISSLEIGAKRHNFITLDILTKEEWTVMQFQYKKEQL